MSFHLWTIFHLLSLFPASILLARNISAKSEETKESRRYYSLFLISLYCLAIFNFIDINSPEDSPLISQIFLQLTFISAGFVVLFFVLSAEYFTKVPTKLQLLFFSIPLILIIIFSFLFPIRTELKSYGWEGDIENPIARWIWIGSINIVVFYSIINLFSLRNSIVKNIISNASILTFSINEELRKRLNFFIFSAILALIAGTFAYIIHSVLDFPNVAALAVNFSFLPSYLSFKKESKPNPD